LWDDWDTHQPECLHTQAELGKFHLWMHIKTKKSLDNNTNTSKLSTVSQFVSQSRSSWLCSETERYLCNIKVKCKHKEQRSFSRAQNYYRILSK
jgi:hypothetical protein